MRNVIGRQAGGVARELKMGNILLSFLHFEDMPCERQLAHCPSNDLVAGACSGARRTT